MYKVLIAGSRHFRTREETEEVRLAVYKVVQDLDKAFEGEDLLIISGGAHGVDTWAESAANVLDIPCHVEEVKDWWVNGHFNRGAGHARNRRMLDMEPDLCVYFWDGHSPGTKGCIEEAQRRGLEVEVNIFGGGKI